jgi:lipoprotein-releasing system ATP-binding protein
MDKKILVELKGISKKYPSSEGELEILKKIDLQIYEGEKIAIVGPSGIGKTTLLNIIGTLDKPSSGDIYFFGKRLDWEKEEELLMLRREKIGFIFQLHYLIPEFSVMENVILPGLICGWKLKDCIKRGKELLKKLQLLERENYKPSSLSGGERQRVAIARALFLNPPLLLADEPTGNLDPESAREVVNTFLMINKVFGTSIVMVTHNWELAKLMDKIFLIKNGFLVKLEEQLQ